MFVASIYSCVDSKADSSLSIRFSTTLKASLSVRTAGMKLKSILKQTYSIIFCLFSAFEKAGVPLFGISIFTVLEFNDTRTGMHPESRIPVNPRIADISFASNSKFNSTDEKPLGFLSCKDNG